MQRRLKWPFLTRGTGSHVQWARRGWTGGDMWGAGVMLYEAVFGFVPLMPHEVLVAEVEVRDHALQSRAPVASERRPRAT